MNTLAHYYTQTAETFHRRFHREETWAIFEVFRSCTREIGDSTYLVNMMAEKLKCGQSDKESIIEKIRAFSPWETACFQIFAFTYWDEYGEKEVFNSWDYAFTHAHHTKDWYTMRDVSAIISDARLLQEQAGIKNYKLDESQKKLQEALDLLYKAMDDN
jgi:hypothetical protein